MRVELVVETKADTKADTDIDTIIDIELETKADTKLVPNIGAKIDVRTNTKLKRVGNIKLYTKVVVEFGIALGAELTIVAVEVPRINSKNVDIVYARERSSARLKRIYNSISKID